MKKKHIPWIVILLVLLIDQTLKILIKTNMTLGQSIPVLGNWFYLHFTENYGMAFGMEFSGEYGKLALSLFRIVALGFIGWYTHKLVKKDAPAGLLVCMGLIFAGALGNILDSAFYGLIFSESFFYQAAQMFPEGGGYATFLHGKVVDMFYFPIIRGFFPQWFPFWSGQEFVFFRPVFNVADAAITLGVFTMLIFQKRFFAFEKQEDLSPDTDAQNEAPATSQPEAGPADPAPEQQP
ncbi:MAG: lipoprotein signal peptidase [Bacteroidales bacterium]|nr:lipoprotein signal peptidase [Bacteroidales bacterium]